MAGRIRSGESWCFAELRNETAVFVDSELAYLDRFDLRPSEQSPNWPWMMADHEYIATAIAYDPAINEEEVRSIRSNFGPIENDLTYGMDLTSDQLMIGRFLARTGTSFRRARECYEQAVLRWHKLH